MRPSHRPAPRPLLAALLACAPALLPAGPIHDTAFTYQGRLVDNGAAANGAYDLVFRLYDDEFVGVEVAPSVAVEDLAVVDGLFTTTLDFGVEDYQFGFWLEIEVRPGDSTDPHVPLSGRVFLQQVPAAMKARLAEQAFDAFTLGGNEASAFAPAAHFHSVLTTPDGSIEVFVVDGSHQARVQVGDAGLDIQSPASGQFDARALAGTTELRLLGQDIGPGQSQPTDLFIQAGGNPTATPSSGGDVWLQAGESASGSGGWASLIGGSGGFPGSSSGNGGPARVLGGDSLGGGAGGDAQLRGGSGSTGGDIAIDGGAASSFPGEGGLVGIRGGEGALSGQGPGGAVRVVGGRGTPAGEVLVQGGTGYPGNDAEGGDVRIIGGIGGGQIEGDGGPGGDIFIEGGRGYGDLNNPGGDVHIAGGASSFGTSTGTVFIDSPAQFASTVHLAPDPSAVSSLSGGGVGLGGVFEISGSSSPSGNFKGAQTIIRGGSVIAGGTAPGGDVFLVGGDGAVAGFTNEEGGHGGSVVLRGGFGRGAGQNAGGSIVLEGGLSSDGQPVRYGIVDIRSLVSILRNGARPENGALLQAGGILPGDGNGAYLSNDGVWTNASDANKKTVVGDVDPREVLARVLALPLKNWRLKDATDAPLHMGPMAQDFFAAFGLGGSERHIGSVDADGVALAAIQGLHAEADERLRALEAENHHLRERLARLEALLIANSEAQP